MSVNWQELYSARARGIKASQIRELLKLTSKQDIISFAGGLPDPTLFPLAHFQQVTDFVLQQISQGIERPGNLLRAEITSYESVATLGPARVIL